jgi:hypothetical protein
MNCVLIYDLNVTVFGLAHDVRVFVTQLPRGQMGWHTACVVFW